jgi:UPF0755 protein
LRRYDKARRRDSEGIGTHLEALRSSSSTPRGQRRKRKKSPVGPILLIVLLAGVLYLLVSAAFGGGEPEPVMVVVEEGDTLSSVADKLEEAGVVSSSTLFKLGARIRGGDTEIKPGEYRFEPGEDGGEILETLSRGDSISAFMVTIPEGLTLSETAERVAQQSDVPAAEFEAAARKTDYGYAFLEDPAIETTEGFLFPEKYKFEKGVDAAQIVDRLLEQYLVETEDLDLVEAQERFNLTEYELITLASLVEKESANPEERPLIASVIYNRIRAGMPLQIDATIQYALGKPKETLSLDDLEVDSPYNTYTNPGLPPGPIANPSRASIEAALKPARTDYLYYVLESDG